MPADERPPSFQFYPRDWIVDTRHMTVEQRGRYHDALCESWVSESYGVATEDQWREWLGYSLEEWPSVRPAFAQRFKITTQAWIQQRMALDRSSQVKRHLQSKKGARITNEARWGSVAQRHDSDTIASRTAVTPASASASALDSDSPASRSHEHVLTQEPSGGKSNTVTARENRSRSPFTRPTRDEVAVYCAERRALGKANVDFEAWFDHYDSNGWRVGKSAMKDWRAAVRTWERSEFAASGNGAAPTSEPVPQKPKPDNGPDFGTPVPPPPEFSEFVRKMR